MEFIENNKIIDYLIRLICFYVVVKFGFYYVGCLLAIVFIPLFFILSIAEDYVKKCLNYSQIGLFDSIMFSEEFISIFVYLSAILTFYVLAKIFGIFKKLDKLNFFVSFFIIVLISLLLIKAGEIDFLVSNIVYENGLKYANTMYMLIPAFLLYKFFNFLTKKFPTPFKQIGYFFSIEFYKDLYKKLLNKPKPSD